MTERHPNIQAVPIKAPFNSPWLPVSFVNADGAALWAVINGNADADQQRRAMKFIIEDICEVGGMSYRPGPEGVSDMNFAEGKRFVANQILKIAKTRTDVKPQEKIK